MSYTGKVDPEYDMLKFGKKMHLAKPTSEQVLEAHLR